MGTLIDGKKIASKLHTLLAVRVKRLTHQGITPHLGVILVGNHAPSATYVRKKQEAAAELGIACSIHRFAATTTPANLIAASRSIQEDAQLTGLIIQLPLPERLYIPEVLNSIDPAIDVDCLTNQQLGRLVMNTEGLVPPTPGAVLTILEELAINPAGKNITIVGTGALVGKPLAILLMNAGASVATCNSRTTDIASKCREADILVCGVGKKNIIRGDMIKPGAVVIDTGISFEGKKMYGDVNVEEVLERAAFVTPTPGGVGPITVARLLWNTVLAAEDLLSKR